VSWFESGGASANGESGTFGGGMTQDQAATAVRLGLVDPARVNAAPGEYGGPAGADDDADLETVDDADTTPEGQRQVDPEVAKLQSKVAELEGKLSTSQDPNPQQTYQTVVSQIDAASQAAYVQFQQHFTTGGMEAEPAAQLARALVESKRAELLTQARADMERQVMMPAVRREVAVRMAKEYDASGKVLKADDLANETTVEGMKARAKALVETRRDSSFSKRKIAGIDRAEGGSSGGAIDQQTMDSLSPLGKIKIGLSRGHAR
jgi:hypothetical protein